MLIAPVDSTKDAEKLFRETVESARTPQENEELYNISLEEIDSMEGKQFEDWIISRLKELKFKVNETPISHDGGADCIATKNGTEFIIQCKVTGNPNNLMDEEATEDLIRAKKNYNQYSNPRLIALTNAKDFSYFAKELARNNDISLIKRDNLLQWNP